MSRATRMEDQLAYLIASINRQLEEELNETLRPEGIALEQFRILSALASTDGRSMRELAAVVLVDAGSLTKIIDRMVVDGLVYRAAAPEDRRKVLIFLARKGEALHEKLQGAHHLQQERLLSKFADGKAREFETLLRGVIASRPD